ncbi:hypothetical protein [Deinococcus maricopensis]|uniref:hypothetical protein n=1 Tax=Deinococcus maricopensis TaxID=309887 RepID=UPI001C54D359|nr:hypothetical protein [Deinococcus maricopensis]
MWPLRSGRAGAGRQPEEFAVAVGEHLAVLRGGGSKFAGGDAAVRETLGGDGRVAGVLEGGAEVGEVLVDFVGPDGCQGFEDVRDEGRGFAGGVGAGQAEGQAERDGAEVDPGGFGHGVPYCQVAVFQVLLFQTLVGDGRVKLAQDVRRSAALTTTSHRFFITRSA